MWIFFAGVLLVLVCIFAFIWVAANHAKRISQDTAGKVAKWLTAGLAIGIVLVIVGIIASIFQGLFYLIS
jgi:hypothetical protein